MNGQALKKELATLEDEIKALSISNTDQADVENRAPGQPTPGGPGGAPVEQLVDYDSPSKTQDPLDQVTRTQ